MNIHHRTLIQNAQLRVYEFSYAPRTNDDFTNATFLNQLENAYEQAINLVVGNQLHSIYSSHVNAANDRAFTRIVIVGNINNV